MSGNGKLPSSELARIYHPSLTVYLQKNAAAAWNTLNLVAWQFGKALYPGGPLSAYRSVGGQVSLYKLYLSGKGNLAAVPGTSNHGWGLAVDLALLWMRSWIDVHGARFGWAKKWSDAPSEWWHLRWRAGVWKQRPDPGPSRRFPVLREGSGGPGQRGPVLRCQRLLRNRGYKCKADGEFGAGTRRAVLEFQKAHKLPEHGVVTQRIWRALERKSAKR